MLQHVRAESRTTLGHDARMRAGADPVMQLSLLVPLRVEFDAVVCLNLSHHHLQEAATQVRLNMSILANSNIRQALWIRNVLFNPVSFLPLLQQQLPHGHRPLRLWRLCPLLSVDRPIDVSTTLADPSGVTLGKYPATRRPESNTHVQRRLRVSHLSVSARA